MFPGGVGLRVALIIAFRMFFRLMIKSLNVRVFSCQATKWNIIFFPIHKTFHWYQAVPKYVPFYLDRKPLFCTVFPLSFYCNLLAFAWLMISFEIFHEALAQLGIQRFLIKVLERKLNALISMRNFKIMMVLFIIFDTHFKCTCLFIFVSNCLIYYLDLIQKGGSIWAIDY